MNVSELKERLLEGSESELLKKTVHMHHELSKMDHCVQRIQSLIVISDLIEELQCHNELANIMPKYWDLSETAKHIPKICFHPTLLSKMDSIFDNIKDQLTKSLEEELNVIGWPNTNSDSFTIDKLLLEWAIRFHHPYLYIY